ncbi:glycosyltransferase family 4 protein [Rhodopirellula sp. P2]|uniref:glycosyltransferase family 4 protein n=1 Tax=Rhodopirellula sp. P2 TaxID=2127060 RepID=UPI0030841BDB
MLESFGHEVTRFTRMNDSMSGAGAITNARMTVWNSGLAREIQAAVKQNQIDVVHFHNTFPAISPAAIKAAHEAGAATVLTLHNSRILCPKAVCFRDGQPCTDCVAARFATPAIRHACFHDSRLASGVVAVTNWLHRTSKTYQRYLNVAIAPTQFVKTRYEESGHPMPPIAVKPHFVESDLPLGQGDGGYALFVGRLSEEKGLKVLLDAWNLLTQPIPLKVIGDGPLRHLLDQPQENVEYLGRLDQAAVYQTMADAAMLILPSHCAESFGRVVVEAFACGTPVVCANQGGQAELVHPSVGALFRSGDAEELASVVDGFVQNAEQTIAMREMARREYESKYTAAINHDQLIAIYQAALKARGRNEVGRMGDPDLRIDSQHSPNAANEPHGSAATLTQNETDSPEHISHPEQAHDEPMRGHDQLGRRASSGSTLG